MPSKGRAPLKQKSSGRAKGPRSSGFPQPNHSGPKTLWKVNQRCNFRCEYCFSAGTNPYREHPDCGRYSPRHIAQSFDRTGLSWGITMTGGEPFLYPDFVRLCQELTRNHFLSIFTNLSTANILQFAKAVDPGRVPAVYAALHIAERERYRKLDQFIDYVCFFQKMGFKVRVDYVAYPPLFHRLERDLKMLTTRGVEHVSLQVFQGVYRSRIYPLGYGRKEREVFWRLAADARELELIEHTRGFFGQPCRGGHEFIYINIGGDIRRCPASVKFYGNFFTGRYRLDDQPLPCPYPRCLCPGYGPELAGGPRLGLFRIVNEMVQEGVSLTFNRVRMGRIIRSVRFRLLGKRPEA